MKALIWCGVLAPVLRLSLILVLGLMDPAYSHLRDYISELGAQEAPFASVTNLFAIGLVGVLLSLFSVALYRVSKPDILAVAGSAFLAASGLAFIAVALFPCDPGCSLADPSDTMLVHFFAGMSAMATQALAPLAFGLRLFSRTGNRWHSVLSLICGIVAVTAVILVFTKGSVLTFPGLVQKTFQVATDLWVLISAVSLWKSAE